MFEHAVDGVKQFAHDGDQGEHLGLAASAQMFIEGAQVGLTADGDQGRHIEGAAEVDVAVLADARFLMHGAARGMLARIEPGMSYQLPHVEVLRRHGQLGQQGNGAGFADALGAEEQVEAQLETRVLPDDFDRLDAESLDGAAQGTKAALQVAAYGGGRGVGDPGSVEPVLLGGLGVFQSFQTARQRVQLKDGGGWRRYRFLMSVFQRS